MSEIPNFHSDRPPAYGGCICECHEWDVSHVMPCCYPDDDNVLLSKWELEDWLPET